jgi:hypothetical protein
MRLDRIPSLFMLLASLAVPSVSAAVDAYPATEGQGAPPAKSQPAKKPHRKHKKVVTSDGPTPGAPATPENNPLIPGITGDMRGNDAGKPNLQSGDHVPGTTGTSGQ